MFQLAAVEIPQWYRAAHEGECGEPWIAEALYSLVRVAYGSLLCMTEHYRRWGRYLPLRLEPVPKWTWMVTMRAPWKLHPHLLHLAALREASLATPVCPDLRVEAPQVTLAVGHRTFHCDRGVHVTVGSHHNA